MANDLFTVNIFLLKEKSGELNGRPSRLSTLWVFEICRNTQRFDAI